MELGTVTDSQVVKNKDSDKLVRLLQATITDDDDVQSIEQVTQSGDDSPPLNGAVVISISFDESYKLAIAVDDGVLPERQPGEKEFYCIIPGATDDDPPVKVCRIKLLKTGDIEVLANKKVIIKGLSDNAVRFASLNAAIEDLKIQINAQNTVISANNALVNGHFHPPPGPVGSRPPNIILLNAIPVSASIAAAKVDTVTMPNAAEDIET